MSNHTPPTGPLPHPAYRPDIDGLRALAVLCVMGFHAFPGWIRGGFIGVDIFFVISGFLISTIILKGLQQECFSFREFYSRRIRRIFPALITVLIACFALGWCVLLASEYKTLGKHMLGGAGFISNFVLLRENGYFDETAATKPLLHLWSLGIEEQFYIVWPFLLWAAWRLKYNIRVLIVLVGGISFAWNIVPVLYGPITLPEASGQSLWRLLLGTESIATFYLPQARFWELLIGSLLAYFSLSSLKIGAGGNLLSWGGALLIALGLALITHESPFPGFWALLPTLGAACIIAAGAQSWLNRTLFSNRVMVGIGLISYPLYLWHWPLLSFAFIAAGEEPAPIIRGLCLAAAFGLAWLTYRWIEKPLRFGRHPAAKTMLLMGVMAAVGGMGLATYKSNGLEFRAFAQRTKQLSDAVFDWRYPGSLIRQTIEGIETAEGADLYVNMQKPPEMVFLGDSHMQHYAHRFAQTATDKNIPVLFLTGGGCLTVPHVFSVYHFYCHSMLDYFYAILKKNPGVKTLVLGIDFNGPPIAGQEYYYQKGDTKEWLDDAEGMRLTLASFRDFIAPLAKKYRVYVILDSPTLELFTPKNLIKNRLTFLGMEDIAATVALPQQQVELAEKLRSIAATTGAKVIDPLPTLCPGNACRRFYGDGALIYRDSNHLTAGFVTQEADYIDAVFSPAR